HAEIPAHRTMRRIGLRKATADHHKQKKGRRKKSTESAGKEFRLHTQHDKTLHTAWRPATSLTKKRVPAKNPFLMYCFRQIDDGTIFYPPILTLISTSAGGRHCWSLQTMNSTFPARLVFTFVFSLTTCTKSTVFS